MQAFMLTGSSEPRELLGPAGNSTSTRHTVMVARPEKDTARGREFARDVGEPGKLAI